METPESVMYISHWRIHRAYTEGDLVVFPLKKVYVCRQSHLSNNVTVPSKECIYWLSVNTYDNDNLNANSNSNIMVCRKRKRNSESENEIEKQIKNFLKVKRNNEGLKTRILNLDVPLDIKSILFERFSYMKDTQSTSERQKALQWLNIVCDLPFNKSIPMKITSTSSLNDKQKYFRDIRDVLDSCIYGLNDVKDILVEHIGRMVTSSTKGTVIALSGIAGTGKTSLLRHGLANALNVPFYQINCGGMSDGSVLIGHSDTYVSSRPGKIVEILTKAGCNNPVIYLDEIDKISKTRWREIYGILTHILDPEQNMYFVDNYLPEINIDLSNVTFVLSFNNAEDIDPIVLDRLKVINIENPSKETKINITKEILLPRLCKELDFEPRINQVPSKRRRCARSIQKVRLYIDENLIEYIVEKVSPDNTGVRNIKQFLETLINKVNMDVLTGCIESKIINKDFIDKILESQQKDQTVISNQVKMMYI